MFRKRHKQLGYTLTELLISVSVMGILSAIAIPNTRDMILDNRRVNHTNNLVYLMHVARSEAIKRNQQITACPSANGWSCDTTDWSGGFLIWNDADRDRVLDIGADEAIIQHVNGIDGVEVTVTNFGTRFTYRPNGRVMGATQAQNNGQFTFCDSRGADEARVVIVGTNGRPQISETQADGSAPDCS